MDIATEELSHLEVIGSIVGMLNKGAKGELAAGSASLSKPRREFNRANNSSIDASTKWGNSPCASSCRRRPASLDLSANKRVCVAMSPCGLALLNPIITLQCLIQEVVGLELSNVGRGFSGPLV